MLKDDIPFCIGIKSVMYMYLYMSVCVGGGVILYHHMKSSFIGVVCGKLIKCW